jgi:hypothetical protein
VKIALLAEAEAELDDATAWYDEQRDGIPPIRRFLLQRFPYAIAYQAHPDLTTVLAIVHGRRRPLYWVGRAR